MKENTIVQVGVPVLVRKGNTILMGESTKDGPQKGQFVIPGGRVDFLESMQDTAQREILEETGLYIQNIQAFKGYEIILPCIPRHRILYLHTADWASGEIATGDNELVNIDFFSKEQVKELAALGKIDRDGPVYRMLCDTGWLD